jgi:hypothetical protein
VRCVGRNFDLELDQELHGSGGGDVVDVERDGGQATVGSALGVAAVNAASGGEGQPVEGLVALGVVRGPAAVGLV